MAVKPVKTSTISGSSSSKSMFSGDAFYLGKENYILMAVGAVLILTGAALMSGGGTTDPNVFPKEELYSFRRITLAPIVVLLGFAVELFAILKRPSSK